MTVSDIKKKLSDESGNTVIEASFIVTITLFVIFFLLLLGFVYYQKTLFQTVANQTSTSIARTYTYRYKDPAVGYIDIKQLHDLGLKDSAYWLGGSNSGKNTIEKEEAKKLLKHLESQGRLLKCQKNSMKTDVKIRKSDALFFQNEITVSIEAKYYIPFIRLLGVETDGLVLAKASSRAICADILGLHTYYRTIEVLLSNLTELNFTKIVQSGVRFITNVLDSGKSLYQAFEREDDPPPTPVTVTTTTAAAAPPAG